MLIKREDLCEAVKLFIPKELKIEDITFACVGTDRSTGDALGPLVGTELEKIGYNVIGTLNNPLHAGNLDKVNLIDKNKIIAIDACLGRLPSVGNFIVKKEPLKPGAGVNKNLPPIGNAYIAGVVNVGGFMEYFVLQNTRLNLVINMANDIINAIKYAFPLNNSKGVICNAKHDRPRKKQAKINNGNNALVEKERLESNHIG